MSDDTSSGRRHPDAICEQCSLNEPRNTFVPSNGPRTAQLAIVGEGPGVQEGKTGIPFSGPSGQLLDHVLSQHGIDRRNAYLTNAVLCRPPGNRTPTGPEVSCCKPRLEKELRALDSLDAILTLGNTATSAVLPASPGITNARIGAPKRWPQNDRVQVVPTFHPAACLRSADYYPSLVFDVGKLRREHKAWAPPVWKVIDDWEDAVRAIDELYSFDELVIDIEAGIEKDTDFGHPERYQLLCVGIGFAPGRVLILGENALTHSSVKFALRGLIEQKKITCHNGKFDLTMWPNARLHFDTMLASYVLDERQGGHGLKDLSKEILGAPDWEHEIHRFVGSGKKKANYNVVPRDILYKYCAYDIHNTWQLKEYYEVELERDGFRPLHDMLCRASDMLMKCEMAGIAMDVEYLAKLNEEMTESLTERRKDMSQWLENPNSWQQVQRALKAMGVTVTSTAELPLKMAQRKLKEDSEPNIFINKLLAYRKEAKLHSTYVKGLLERIHEGRIHPSFLLHGTTTGRLSSRNPNIQNQPRGPKIRSAYIPEEGRVFVQADYKTAELRVVAIESGCAYLLDLFPNPDRDIHGEVAEQRYGAGYTKDQRVRAKAVVFGLSYGREAPSIADEFNMPVKEAQAVIDAFFSMIPEVKEWQHGTKSRVLSGEDLRNHFGRMRRFHLITRENRADIEREALAFIPQSTASDICLQAATRLRLDHELDVRILVHDSILVQTRPESASEVGELMSQVMMDTAATLYSDRIPFYVDTQVGDNWGLV